MGSAVSWQRVTWRSSVGGYIPQGKQEGHGCAASQRGSLARPEPSVPTARVSRALPHRAGPWPSPGLALASPRPRPAPPPFYRPLAGAARSRRPAHEGAGGGHGHPATATATSPRPQAHGHPSTATSPRPLGRGHPGPPPQGRLRAPRPHRVPAALWCVTARSPYLRLTLFHCS